MKNKLKKWLGIIDIEKRMDEYKNILKLENAKEYKQQDIATTVMYIIKELNLGWQLQIDGNEQRWVLKPRKDIKHKVIKIN